MSLIGICLSETGTSKTIFPGRSNCCKIQSIFTGSELLTLEYNNGQFNPQNMIIRPVYGDNSPKFHLLEPAPTNACSLVTTTGIRNVLTFGRSLILISSADPLCILLTCWFTTTAMNVPVLCNFRRHYVIQPINFNACWRQKRTRKCN